MMMMTHEDRQQCLQFFRGGRFVFLFSKQEKCRQTKGQVRSCRVRSGPVGSGRSGRVRSCQVWSGRVGSGTFEHCGRQDIKPLAQTYGICLLNLQSALFLKVTIRDGVERIFAILRAALTRHLRVRAPRAARVTIVT